MYLDVLDHRTELHTFHEIGVHSSGRVVVNLPAELPDSQEFVMEFEEISENIIRAYTVMRDMFLNHFGLVDSGVVLEFVPAEFSEAIKISNASVSIIGSWTHL